MDDAKAASLAARQVVFQLAELLGISCDELAAKSIENTARIREEHARAYRELARDLDKLDEGPLEA
jgi:hypothetical protein